MQKRKLQLDERTDSGVSRTQDLDECDKPVQVEPQSAKEAALWSNHPLSRSFMVNEIRATFDEPAFDIGALTIEENRAKDVCEYQPRIPTPYPLPLESCEQQIHQQIEEDIGDKGCAEAKLQVAPCWIFDKAIETKKKYYKESVEVFHRSNLPRNANIVYRITSLQ